MAADAKKSAKTESLTIRLDPKTRFMLEFLARLTGQTITTVVERAIAHTANNRNLDFEDERTWADFWDVIEGVRALKIAEVKALYPTFEDEQRLAFAKDHWPFFYVTDSKKTLRRTYIEILWPRIDEFMALHAGSKSSNWWAAGQEMAKTLLEAQVAPPDWPPKPPKKGPSEAFSDDLNDEIPF